MAMHLRAMFRPPSGYSDAPFDTQIKLWVLVLCPSTSEFYIMGSMKVHNHSHSWRPRLAVILGDPSGIGRELIAKLLSNPTNSQKADIFLLADQSELESAVVDAGNTQVLLSSSAGPNGAELLDDNTADKYPTIRAKVSKAAGERVIHQHKRALSLVLKLGGMKEVDEQRWFASQLDFNGRTSEINLAGPLWTGRVTSHIGLEEVAGRITKESTLEVIELLHRLRRESGISFPRLGVCALNPHNGESGSFGRQEIDHIQPAVEAARAKGIDVQGPFPCDTIVIKRQHFDGLVTLYHDQGQIAMKLLSFDGGVTMLGGLPIPVATLAHGTAFDIAGKNFAAVTSTQNVFDIAFIIAERRILAQISEGDVAI
ncbi:4-hydroxythreonine-4-phosphate dehydrogenase [Coleophoma cylindrospora]|uniref:4-hydroxythreonine-4-phosphate dehydrogenase n=1 Tax=Coleophoma cylindrospora TaxID=1849047 RepID=A0A3D8QF97_9HELO|nr:4-hydroxythreonine-4-phosphate dehydrogenase [Coleophoma cylindrospora]